MLSTDVSQTGGEILQKDQNKLNSELLIYTRTHEKGKNLPFTPVQNQPKSLRDGPFLWIDLPITMALNLPKSLREGPLNISSNHVPIFPLIPSYIVSYLAMSS